MFVYIYTDEDGIRHYAEDTEMCDETCRPVHITDVYPPGSGYMPESGGQY